MASCEIIYISSFKGTGIGAFKQHKTGGVVMLVLQTGGIFKYAIEIRSSNSIFVKKFHK
jgi:hypothetical protein